MAPELLGRHLDLVCKNCRCPYPFTLRSPRTAVCPNCGYSFPAPLGPTRPGDGMMLLDRVGRPQRWDLVRFRQPGRRRPRAAAAGRGPRGRPPRRDGGDRRGRRIHQRAARLEGAYCGRQHVAAGLRHALCPGQAGAAEARLGARPPRRPWTCELGQWTFHGSGDRAELLTFVGDIRDELSYNGEAPEQHESHAPLTGDIRLRCTIEQFSGDGSLGFQWEFADQKVEVTVQASGEAELTVFDLAAPGGSSAPQKATATLPGGLLNAKQLGLVVRDGQVALLGNDAVLAPLPLGPPDVEVSRRRLKLIAEAEASCRLNIVVRNCTVTLSRILLDREVYFRSLSEMPDAASARRAARPTIPSRSTRGATTCWAITAPAAWIRGTWGRFPRSRSTGSCGRSSGRWGVGGDCPEGHETQAPSRGLPG